MSTPCCPRDPQTCNDPGDPCSCGCHNADLHTEIATLRQRLAEADRVLVESAANVCRLTEEIHGREARHAVDAAALRLEVETLTAQHSAAWERANATLRSMLLPCPKCGDGIREGTLAVDGPDGRPEHLACPKDLAAEVQAELVAERDAARTEVERLRGLLSGLAQIGATIKPRRPYYDDQPDGYEESDRDYTENNSDAAVALLDLAKEVRALLHKGVTG